MSIPKKGSRTFILNETTYRYLLRDEGESTLKDIKGFSATKLRVTVQRDEDRPGRVLQATLDSKNWDGVDCKRCGKHKASLLPEDIGKIIETGLKKGWDPQAKGAAFQLTGPLDFKDYEVRA